MSSTGLGPTLRFAATTILFPYGILARLPSPGNAGRRVRGVAWWWQLASTHQPIPVPRIQFTGLALHQVRRGSVVIAQPRVTVSFGVICHLSSKYGAQLGKLKSKSCAAKYTLLGIPNSSEASESPVVPRFGAGPRSACYCKSIGSFDPGQR